MEDREPIDRELLLRYILGLQLDADDVARIEQQCFGNDDALRRMQDLEDELVDCLLMEELPPDQAEVVRHRIAESPRWREKWELARRLRDAALQSFPASGGKDKAVHPSRPVGLVSRRTAWGAAIAATVMAGFGLLLWKSRNDVHPRPSGTPATQQATGRPSVAAITVALATPATRGGLSPKTTVALPEEDVLLELQVWLGVGPHGNYRARLLTESSDSPRVVPDGDVRVVQSGIAGQTVSVTVPAAVLTAGEYRLRLEGSTPGSPWETVGIYEFVVTRK